MSKLRMLLAGCIFLGTYLGSQEKPKAETPKENPPVVKEEVKLSIREYQLKDVQAQSQILQRQNEIMQIQQFAQQNALLLQTVAKTACKSEDTKTYDLDFNTLICIEHKDSDKK